MLDGGTGVDTFVFGQDSVVPNPTTDAEREAETDTGEDFTQSQGDKLDFRGLKEHSLFRGGERLSFLATEGAAFTGVKGQVRTSRIRIRTRRMCRWAWTGTGEWTSR